MKKFFAIATVALFLTAVSAPVVSVSAQEPQKKESAKTNKKECIKDDPKTSNKKACCDAKKKEVKK